MGGVQGRLGQGEHGKIANLVFPSQVVKELLDVGPMLNAIDADGCSALHLAAQDGHAAAVRLLKEHGIVDGLPNLAGRCPSDLARQHGHVAIAKKLAEGAVMKVRRTICPGLVPCIMTIWSGSHCSPHVWFCPGLLTQ